MPIRRRQVIEKLRAGLGIANDAEMPRSIAKAIVPTYLVNDENNPVAVHPHGPIALPRGGTTNVSDNQGGFTSNTQAIILIGSRRTLPATQVGEAAYTVSAGKTFFLTDLSVYFTAANIIMRIRDTADSTTFGASAEGNTTTDIMWVSGANSGDQARFHFTAPMPFVVALTINSNASAGDAYITASGWEEDT